MEESGCFGREGKGIELSEGWRGLCDEYSVKAGEGVRTGVQSLGTCIAWTGRWVQWWGTWNAALAQAWIGGHKWRLAACKAQPQGLR